MAQNALKTMLEAASGCECACGGTKAGSLLTAARNGCMRCCSGFIQQAGKCVRGPAALVEAVKGKHLNVLSLLLQFEGNLQAEEMKTVYQLASAHGKATFDEVLKLVRPEFYWLVREMRGMPCVCAQDAINITSHLACHCIRCCAMRVDQVSNALDKTAVELPAVKPRCLVPVKFMTSLQTRLKSETGFTELMIAVSNNLYDAAVLLADEQRDAKDSRGRKAADYAASVHNPKLWALFPKDIGEEYAADLEAAHSSACVCGAYPVCLSGAVQRNCLRCCARFIREAVSAGGRQTELMQAARGFGAGVVKLLMHKQLGLQDEAGKSALMHAVEASNPPAVSLLAAGEARLRDKRGRIALMYALLGGRAELSKLLLPLEGDLRDAEGRDIEEYAFRSEDPEIWRLLDPAIGPEEGAMLYERYLAKCFCGGASEDLVSAARNDCYKCCLGWKEQAGKVVQNTTATMEAARGGNSAIARLLLEKEAGLQDKQGRTALTFAAEAFHLRVVTLLFPLEKDIRTADGKPPAAFATWPGNDAVLRHILDEAHPGAYEALQRVRETRCACGNASKTLTDAARNGCLKCVAARIHATRYPDGNRALIPAAAQGHVEVARLLLPFEAGMRGGNGTTALMEAAREGHAEIVRLLAPREAGMAARDGSTAIANAVLRRRRECFGLLRHYPGELKAAKIQPSMLAACDGDLRAVLRCSGELRGVFEPGLNVLHFAFLRDSDALLRALTRDPKARASLLKPAAQMAWNQVGMASALLSCPESLRLFAKIADLVHAAGRQRESALWFDALFRYSGRGVSYLRPFSNPASSELQNAMQQADGIARIAGAFVALKNIGVIGNSGALPFRYLSSFSQAREYLSANPLKQKQLGLAEKQLPKGAPLADERNFAWRETETEASFNRALLLEARELWWQTPQTPRTHPIPAPASRRALKLARNAVLIHGAYLYACTKLREMLDE